MPAVQVFYHDSARATDADVYHVPGMENETILPPSDNLADKGRPTARPQHGGGPPAPRPASNVRNGAGGPGGKVVGGRSGGPQTRILTRHAALVHGGKGSNAAWIRGG